jgi:hypothetical protein
VDKNGFLINLMQCIIAVPRDGGLVKKFQALFCVLTMFVSCSAFAADCSQEVNGDLLECRQTAPDYCKYEWNADKAACRRGRR